MGFLRKLVSLPKAPKGALTRTFTQKAEAPTPESPLTPSSQDLGGNLDSLTGSALQSSRGTVGLAARLKCYKAYFSMQV